MIYFFLVFLIFLVIILSVALFYVTKAALKFGKLCLEFEEKLNEGVQKLEREHENIKSVASLALAADDVYVRKVANAVKHSRDILANIVVDLSDIRKEEEKKNEDSDEE